ncbi:helix-turn-helix domain-containing protein [Actinomycetaceae bacterium L2_0104]
MGKLDRVIGIVTGLDCAGANADLLPAYDRRLLEPFGRGPTRWVAGAVEQALATLEADSHDALAPRPSIRAFASHALTAALLELADMNSEPVHPDEVAPELVKDIVVRGVELAEITAGIRAMQQVWLDLLIAATMRTSPEGVAAVPSVVASVSRTMDTWTAVVVEAIGNERRRALQTEQVRVRAVIEQLLTGAPVSPETAQRLLGSSMSGWHTCCVVGVPVGGRVEREVLDSMAQVFTRISGQERVLQYETRMGTLCLWATTERRIAITSLTGFRGSEAVAIGLGNPHRGPGGFRRSFVEADDAFQLAIRDCADNVVSYEEDSLAILLTRDEERARWFVDTELGELGADSPEMAEMRMTLRAFFARRMRIAPAADLLHIHRNTLIHRLERIETMLGHSIVERTAQTQTALLLANLFFAERGSAEEEH